MKLSIVAVRDVKAECFNTPFFSQGSAVALRGFIQAVNTPAEDNLFHRYPQDFELWELGTFDPSTGHIESIPTKLCVGSSVVTNKAN